MATIDLGKISFTQKGTWNSGTAYTAKDVVQHTDNNETSSYVAIASSTGQAPSTNGVVNTSNWAIFAKGSTVASNYQSSAWASGTTYTKGDIVQHTDGDTTSSFIYTNSTPASGQSPSTGGTVNTSYWALLAKGQPQTFNSNNLTNDISTLAIRQATQENKGAYNTNSMYVDVFQDSTGVTGLTNSLRSSNEYMVSGSAATGGVDGDTIFLVDGVDSSVPFTDVINNYAHVSLNDISNTGGTPTRSTAVNKWGSNAVIDLGQGTINYGTGISGFDPSNPFTIEFWFKYKSDPPGRERYWAIGNDSTNPQLSYGIDHGSSADINVYADGTNIDPSGTFNLAVGNRDWNHWAFVKKDTGNNYAFYFNGTRVVDSSHSSMSNIANQKFRINGRNSSANTGTEFFNMYVTDFMIHSKAKYTGASFSGGTLSEKASPATEGGSATGSFTSNNITAPSSINKMGAIVSYEDATGTNALNTDIVLQLSADGGSNYSTATLTALPNYSSSIKMAKVNDLSVTAGTNLKYKINFANQAIGSKIARIRGVSLMY